MNYTIETNNLTKRFGKTEAVKDLNLKVPEGSIFAFLGPNGAGKTTTIKTMMNIMTPNKGTAAVLGTDSRRLGPNEFRQIGYVSENQELPEWMSVEYFLNYCKAMYPNWDDGFCQSLLTQFDLPLKQKLKNLSRGMKMKAALVSSLAYHPKLLVFDEPFSGLDPLVREEFINGMLEITESAQWTIFVSSHDIDEVERLADWVGIVDKGELKIIEEAESLQRRFRKVEVTLKDSPSESLTYPDEWLLPKVQGRVVAFVDSQYNQGDSEQKIRSLFFNCSDMAVTGLSLKEIFLVLAKKFKITNL